MRRRRSGVLGVISDTHGLCRPEALAALAGVDRILHGGDVGSAEVLTWLRRVAPVTAVRGNNDRGAWARSLAPQAAVRVGRHRILILHDRNELSFAPESRGFTVVVAGHSHRPAIEELDGVLYVNPGSAGPRRFRLPVSLALLHLSGERVDADVV
ncbi:MAG: metallophosphoesterase family protein, partial [Candidatus Binatia bacterium]